MNTRLLICFWIYVIHLDTEYYSRHLQMRFSFFGLNSESIPGIHLND